MAVYQDARCRMCRRAGMKLFLKGARCYTDKCAIERRAYAPGEHGKSRRIKETNYGVQLREKQKARRMYGILERQFRNYFEKAAEAKGVTGEVLLQMLERRLDNVVYRFGFAVNRSQARQLVRHGHFLVNGRKVDIPSFLVKPGDEVSVREKSRKLTVITNSLDARKGQTGPEWLELSPERLGGRMLSVPTRASIPTPVNEQLIVELYSK
jgi:small subunit ribosomal protein S4